MVSPENAHDDWYYEFLSSGEHVKLNIDQDEVNQNELTVFVDCRIEDGAGRLLGVTGVGVEMSRFQSLLAAYEQDFNLQAFLIDPTGLAQIHTDSSQIGVLNLFRQPSVSTVREEILSNRGGLEIHWYPDKALETCLITRYIQNLDWYLVVEKDTRAIRSTFRHWWYRIL